MDLKTLRAQRKTDFSKIAAELEKSANPESKSYEDTRFWKPERDKAGNATATIRFLNRSEGDELPWAKIWSHGFKGPSGRWFIDDCPTTVGEQCPVCAYNNGLWNSTTDDKSPERTQARVQKRKLNYIANILVVNDPKHPENNGKVFLFKFGKKIFDKIMDKARPTFEDEEPVNVFDYWDGANFKLRMKVVDDYPNYDTSSFDAPSQVAETDEEILEIVNQQYKLSEFTSKEKIKSYTELEKKLEQVMSGSTVKTTAATASEDPPWGDTPKKEVSEKPKATPKPKPPAEDEDDEDMMDYFQKLAEED